MLLKRKHLRLKVCIFGYCFCGSPLPESKFLEILGQPPLAGRSHRLNKTSSPAKNFQKRCIAETPVELSRTSLQKNQAKSKEPPWECPDPRNYREGDALECLNPRNYRAVASPTTRRDLAHPSVREPRALRSAKRYACPHFDNQGSGTPLLEASPHAFGFV